MMDNSESWEHRIYREQQRRSKKGDFIQNDFKRVYDNWYGFYQNELQTLLINLIKYENVPDTFNARGLEYMLRSFGYANLIALDKDHIFVQGLGMDNIGVNIPLGSLIGGFNLKESPELTKLLDGKEPYLLTRLNLDQAKSQDAVYVTMANKFAYYYGSQASDMDMVNYTASLLAEIKASLIENIEQQKTPFVGFTKDGSLTSKVVWQQLASGKPFIQIDSDQYDDISKVITTMPVQTPNLAPTLEDSWHSAFSEFLTFAGIDNSNIDKKERLVADEATANNAAVSAFMQTYLNARQDQLDLLNKAIGTNIKVSVNGSGVDDLINFAKTGTGGLSNDESNTPEENTKD